MTDCDAYGSADLVEIFDAMYADRDDHALWAALAPEDGAILELACGTGRVLLPLARAGREIVGLDFSIHMIERCRAKLADEADDVQRRVRLVQGDMTSFDLGRRFTLITIPFYGFQHLTTVERQLACLSCCHANLMPNGRLVLDLINPDSTLLDEQSQSEGEEPLPLTDGRTMRWSCRLAAHRARQLTEVELTYEIRGGDRSTQRLAECFPLCYLFPHEVEHLLARSGFVVDTLYGHYDRSPFGDDSPEMIVVARPIR